jgi:hypothetical protein
LRWPCLVLALVLTAGTLLAVLQLSRGATDRAVVQLIATWGIIGLGIGAWLLPSLEPYRMARKVGRRLAAISAELKLDPVLLTFQEPSTIYAFGHPVPTVKVWADLYEQLRRHGEVITPVMAHELRGLRARPDLEVEPGEVMECFNLSKGQKQSLTFTRIRPKGDGTRSKPEPGPDPHPDLDPGATTPSARVARGLQELHVE